MRYRFSIFVVMAVLVSACADMSTPSTPSASATTTTQSSPVSGRDNSNKNPGANPNPDQPGGVELKGAIAGRTGTCPSITFSVGTSTVMTNAATTFDDGACTTLQNGDEVEVEGVRQANGTVLASRVEKKNADDDDDEDDDDDHGNRGPGDGNRQGGEVELNGTLAGLGGGCPSITFTVSGSTVSTSGSTRFDDGSCSSLKNGDRVEVKGVRQSPTAVAASRVQKKK